MLRVAMTWWSPQDRASFQVCICTDSEPASRRMGLAHSSFQKESNSLPVQIKEQLYHRGLTGSRLTRKQQESASQSYSPQSGPESARPGKVSWDHWQTWQTSRTFTRGMTHGGLSISVAHSGLPVAHPAILSSSGSSTRVSI